MRFHQNKKKCTWNVINLMCMIFQLSFTSESVYDISCVRYVWHINSYIRKCVWHSHARYWLCERKSHWDPMHKSCSYESAGNLTFCHVIHSRTSLLCIHQDSLCKCTLQSLILPNWHFEAAHFSHSLGHSQLYHWADFCNIRSPTMPRKKTFCCGSNGFWSSPARK